MTVRRSLSFGILASACILLPVLSAWSADCRIDIADPITIPAHKTKQPPNDQPKHAYRLPDDSIVFLGSLTVDADGAAKAYGPHDRGLDWTADAGRPTKDGKPADWWGLATDGKGCGASGNPLVQGKGDPAPGFYVSTTTMTNPVVGDCRKQRDYVDASSIPYVALPRRVARIDEDTGSLVVVEKISGGQPQFAIDVDQASEYGIGEASMELVRRLDLPSNPRGGGDEKRQFVYVVMTDRAGFPSSAQEVEEKARTAFKWWGGEARLEACRQALLAAPR